MHISNILNDKLFVFSGSSKTTDTENEILSLIAEKENLGEISRASLIDNGEDYDSYKLITPEGIFLAKVSLDPDIKSFEKEYQILQAVKHLKLGPTPIATDKIKYGEKISYLITSFEAAQSATEIGKSILFTNYEHCLKRLYELHQTPLSEPSLQSEIQNIFARTSFDNQPEFADLVKTNGLNYQLLSDEISGIKAEIQTKYKNFFGGNSIIHGNITASTLLLGNEGLKLINWQNSCAANPLFDLANLKMEFDYEDDFEYKIFLFYQKLSGNHTWDEYLEVRNFLSMVRLMEYVFAYIREIYLFKSLRQDKILKIFSAFCRNTKAFEHIAAFRRNKEEIIGLFSSPML